MRQMGSFHQNHSALAQNKLIWVRSKSHQYYLNIVKHIPELSYLVFQHEVMNSGITLACFKYFLNGNLKIFPEGFTIAHQTSRLPTTFRILFSKKLCAQSTPWICQCKVIFDSICFVPIAHLPLGKSILKMLKKKDSEGRAKCGVNVES